jgi:hypothetical protein
VKILRRPIVALWLFFLIVFFTLGYSVWYSILVGAIAGVTGSWIASWWKRQDRLETLPPEFTTPSIPRLSTPQRRKSRGIIETQRHLKELRRSRREQKAWLKRFSRLLGRK